jgi:hypothetical protein
MGLVVFVAALGGAMFGMWLRLRLPESHMTDATKDTIKVGVGLVATMTALVLGLVTASAKNSFDEFDSAVRRTAIELLTLDRLLARYGPETGEIRRSLKQAIGAKIEEAWPRDRLKARRVDPAESAGAMELMLDRIRRLTPRDDEQKRLQARALDISESLMTTRWLVVSDAASSIPPVFLFIVTAWLAVTFTSFGLFAPHNGTVIAVLTLCALSVASAMFMVLEMDRPLDGLIRVAPDPWIYAFQRMNL